MNLIFIRHARTESNKDNPNRKVTLKGKQELEESCSKLQPFLNEGSIKLVCSNRLRNIQTMEQIASTIGIKGEIIERHFDPVKNITLLKEEAKVCNEELTFYYLDLYKKKRLPTNIESPKSVIERFDKGLGKISCSNIIVVGNSGPLETFIVLKNLAPCRREIKYSEFMVIDY